MDLSLEDLARNPSPESWRLICTRLEPMPEPEAMAIIAKLEPLLASWDDALRATMCGMSWDDTFLAGTPDPRARIVKNFRFDRIFFGRYGGGFMMRPNVDASAVARLASAPGVRHLTEMNLALQPIGTEGVLALAGGRHFASLRKLKISSCGLDERALVALAGAEFFPRLCEVDVSSNALGGDAIAPLFDPRGEALAKVSLISNPLGTEGAACIALGRLPALSELHVETCELGPDGARALSKYVGRPLDLLGAGTNELGDAGLAALVSGSLACRGLTISEDAIGAAGVAALCDARWPLVKLVLSNNALDDAAMALLAERGPESLEELSIEDNDVTGRGVAALLASPRIALKKLVVSGNRVDAEALRSLGRTMRTIEELDLQDNRVEDAGIVCLAAAAADQLRRLRLARNGITARALETLSGAPWFGGLAHLDVSHNRLGPAAGLLLGARPLERLSLTGTGLGDEGAEALAAAECSPLYLDLEGCDLTDRGVTALARSPVLARVQTLRLGKNRITDQGARALVESPHLRALQELFIEENLLGDDAAVRFAAWQGPLAFHTDGNLVGTRGEEALKSLPARCCP